MLCSSKLVWSTRSKLVVITQVDCKTGVVLGPPFAAFLTFDGSGTLVETTANAAFLPGQRSPGHGAWSRAGQHTYNAASEAFVEFTSAPHGPFPGFPMGRQRLSQFITVQEEALTSTATVQFIDSMGTVVISGCATATGTLFQ